MPPKTFALAVSSPLEGIAAAGLFPLRNMSTTSRSSGSLGEIPLQLAKEMHIPVSKSVIPAATMACTQLLTWFAASFLTLGHLPRKRVAAATCHADTFGRPTERESQDAKWSRNAARICPSTTAMSDLSQNGYGRAHPRKHAHTNARTHAVDAIHATTKPLTPISFLTQKESGNFAPDVP
jgi:hypothetical protein